MRFLIALLVQNCKKARVFGIFWGAAIRQISQKHVIYGKKCEKGNIQNFNSTFFTAEIGILKIQLKQNICILRWKTTFFKNGSQKAIMKGIQGRKGQNERNQSPKAPKGQNEWKSRPKRPKWKEMKVQKAKMKGNKSPKSQNETK